MHKGISKYSHMLFQMAGRTLSACTVILLLSANALAAGREQLSLSEMLQEPAELGGFLGSFLGKMLFLSVICLLVIGFLRLLFGPKGFLREKRWDEMNEEFRTAEQEKSRIKQARRIYKKRRSELIPLIDKEVRSFSAYVEKFYTGEPEYDKHIVLKAQHSVNVLKNAWFIAAREEAFYAATPVAGQPAPDHALLLAALYHDTGRFEQLRQYKTFIDRESANHGIMGSRELAAGSFMTDETIAMRKLVRSSTILHNRLYLPENLPEPLGLAVKAVRDADKLDIMRVMSEEFAAPAPDPTIVLNLPNEPEKYSSGIMQAVLRGESVRYQDMQTVNDFRLLVCSWVKTFEFASSKTLLSQRGYIEPVLDTLPDTPEMDKVREAVTTALK